MKVAKPWLTGTNGLHPVVTVVWMPDLVSLVLWETGPDRTWYPSSSKRITAEECSTGRYHAAWTELLQRAPGRKCRTRWICPLDLFPSVIAGPQSNGGLQPQLSGWIRNCWLDFPQRWVPDQVLCGLGCVEQDLVDWDSFSRTGSGFLLPLGGKFVFFGYAEGRTHRRISRAASDPDGRTGLSDDWIQQTRMLFRSRTGTELKNILVPEEFPSNRIEEPEPGRPISLVKSVLPPFWPGKDNLFREPGVDYLHSCGMRTSEKGGPVVSLDFLEQKQRRDRWQNGFRAACVLLLVGWMAAFLAACRTGDNYSTGMQPDRLEWETQYRMWETNNMEWSSREKILNARRMPFRLIGTIARGVPENILLDRLQLDDDRNAPGQLYKIEIDGRCLGEEPAATLQEWLERMKAESVLSRIEDMQLMRSEKVLEFSLQGKTEKEVI